MLRFGHAALVLGKKFVVKPPHYPCQQLDQELGSVPRGDCSFIMHVHWLMPLVCLGIFPLSLNLLLLAFYYLKSCPTVL
jgi:hypothetical protein